MDLIKSKKAVIFSILAVVIALFFTIIFSAKIEKPVDHNIILVQTRVSVLNNYLNDFFEYTEVIASISGYSALKGIILDMSEKDNYNPGFEEDFKKCLEHGTLRVGLCPGMTDKDLTFYLNNLTSIAEKDLNINSDYVINSIYVTQINNPFFIDILINLSVNISDDYAYLERTDVVHAKTSINLLKDPIYLVDGTYNQTITSNNLNRSSGDWIPSDLRSLYYNHTYRRYEQGLSFINRIKGNFTYPNTDFLGIQSFVNHTDPFVKAFITENNSMIDYLFWNDEQFNCSYPATIVKITNDSIIPDDFQIDEVNRGSFNISNDDIGFIC